MNTTLIPVIIICLLDCLLLYNIKCSNDTRSNKILYSLDILLMPVIGISIYYVIREYKTKNMEGTNIINKVFDVVLILIAVWIIISMLLNQLSIDTILGRTAVVCALVYNLSIFSKHKKLKISFLLVAVILILIATIVKIHLV